MQCEVRQGTYSIARTFMPGVCGPEGEAATIFAEADRQTDSSATALSLARTACGNCLQLSHCRDQLTDIADTLFMKGVGVPVVGATIVTEPESEIRYATRRELLSLEPHYTFNLSKPLPRDSQNAITILRQMLCADHHLINGARSPIVDWAVDEVLRDTGIRAFAASLELSETEMDPVLKILARLLASHAKNGEDVTSESTFRRYPYEKQINPHTLRMIAPQYLYDTQQVRDMGFARLDIVAYHGAEYWRRVLDAYDSSQCITPKGLIFYCEKYPRDPTPSIEAHIHRTTLRRSGQYHESGRVPATIHESEVNRLEQEFAADYPHISRAMIQDAFHRSATAEVAIAKLEPLKDESVAAVVAEFKDKIWEPALVYAIMHSDDARQWIADYQERIRILTQRVTKLGGQVAPSMIEEYAINPSSQDSTGEEVMFGTDAKNLKKNFSERCRAYKVPMHVPAWACAKIVAHYPEEARWDVITNLNELVETNILHISYLSCALETEAAEIPGFLKGAVGKQGAYFTFTADALVQFDSSARANIIKHARLDPLIYGRTLPDKPNLAEIDLPLWLRPAEMAVLDQYIQRGKRAERVLSGEAEIPVAILRHLGWPQNQAAKDIAMSSIRTSVLRAKNARRAKDRVSKRVADAFGS